MLLHPASPEAVRYAVQTSSARVRLVITLTVVSLLLTLVYVALTTAARGVFLTSSLGFLAFSGLQGLVSLAGLVVFAMWVASACRSAAALGRPVARDTAQLANVVVGLAIASWLVNALFRGLLYAWGSSFSMLSGLLGTLVAGAMVALQATVLFRLAKASDPSTLPPVTVVEANPQAHFRDGAQTERAVSGRAPYAPVGVWLGLVAAAWLTRTVASFFLFSHLDYRRLGWVFSVGTFFHLAALVAVMAVVHAIDARQVEQERRLAAMARRSAP